MLNRYFGNNKSIKLQNHKKYCFRIAFCILLFLRSFNSQSQLDSISQSFENYAVNHLQEKIYVHTDKENYLTGEIVWFKIYEVDAYLNEPLDLSKIAYVEVLNEQHKPVLQAKIALQTAMGSGSFLLPNSLQTGNYSFRCYTNLMKNGSADWFFEKQISIINPLKKPEWTQTKLDIYQVQFFPEGGNLVSGIESKIGFKVTDQFGNAVMAKGYIEDDEKKLEVRFETFRFGMGQFLFKPIGSKKYHAKILIARSELTVDLPKIYEKGTVMRLTENSNHQLIVKVESNNQVHSVNLLIHTRQLLKVAVNQTLINGSLRFIIADSLLGEGISQITLFDDHKNPLCERLYFKKPTKVLNILAKSDEQNYGKRQKVELSINTTENDLPTKSNLSLSLYLIDSLQSAPRSNILSYLWLESDLKGEIENPNYYFSEDADLKFCTENLLLTQGWRRFKGEQQIQEPKLSSNIPELNGQIILARVSKKSNGDPAAGITVYLSVPGERALFFQSVSNLDGELLFNVPAFYGTNQLILQTNNLVDSQYRVEIMEQFVTEFAEKKRRPFVLNESLAGLLKLHSIQAQVGNAYYAEQQQKFSFPLESDTLAFYGKPTHRYNLDEYTRFITMEEVLREYVEGVRLRKTNEGYNLKLENNGYQNYFETEPTILFDGVPVFDVNKLIAMDPLKIKRIEVLNQQFFQNNMVMNGILNCNSYQGDLLGYTLDPNALVVTYEGLQIKREFYEPRYNDSSKSNNRLPDFRNQLIWNSDLATDELGNKKLSFYSSDIIGKYLVVLQGMGNKAAGVTAQFLFEVK